MEIYLLKSTAILAIFWMLYVLFLEKENMHHFKRFYLLASIILAFCIPLLSITEYVYVAPVDGFEFQNEVIPFVINDTLASVEIPFWTLDRILIAVYLIGVTIFSIRFLRNIFKMVKTISVNEKHKQSAITFVLLKQLINPHTFFNFIFLNKSKFQKNEVPEEVILHEETHAKQKHSLDIVFVELLQIIFWFQPFIWLYKKRIKLNHEFLADQAVIDKGVQPSTYQNTLLSYSAYQNYSLSNAINYSSIKKRFTVMKTQTSQKKKWLFSLLILPILSILFYSFSERELVEIEKPIEDELAAYTSTQNAKNNKASEVLMNEYKDFIKKYDETKTIFGDAYERAIIIYDQLMSNAQRASVEKYPERMIPKPNLSKVKPRKLTNSLFKDFKDVKKYAIWVDGKHISNSELNNYMVNDFMHYSGSRVFKNARSEKFPQPNQYHLYTKAGFKATYEDSQFTRYNKATEKYSHAISQYLKGSQTDNSELIILKAKADAIYKTFSADDIKKKNIKTAPPVPAKYISPRNSNQQNIPTSKELATYNAWAKNVRSKFVKYSNGSVFMPPIEEEGLVENLRIYSRMTKEQKEKAVEMPYPNLDADTIEKSISESPSQNQQNPPTAKEVAEYNAWAKKFSNKINKAKSSKYSDYPIIKQRDLVRYKSIYSRMTEKQKATAEAFPNIPPPPPPVMDTIYTYKRLLNRVKSNPKNREANIIYLKKIYNEMNEKQKNQVENPSGIENLPPPPPPPPPTKVPQYKNGNKKTLKQIIEETPESVESGYEVLDNGESHYFIVYKGKKTYYNKDGFITDDKGNILPPPPPPPAPPAQKKANKSKGGPNSSDLKLVLLDKEPEPTILVGSRDYKMRQLLLKVSEEQTKPIDYYISGKKSEYSEVRKFLNKNQDADIQFSEGETNSLSISNKKGQLMTEADLQVVYTEILKFYKQPEANTVFAYKTSSSDDCLKIPQSFNTKNGNTLNIKCINNFSENHFQVYNRWGKLIYSKENYDNTWNGLVEKTFAEKGSDKLASGTYYYVLSSTKLEEPKVGYIYINEMKVDAVKNKRN